MSATAAVQGFAPSLQDARFSSSPGPDALNSLNSLGHCRYWPCELLSAFTLQMAAKGHAVNTSMMLGSREYAMEKLTQAHLLNDKKLGELSALMFEYFDDEPCHAAVALIELSDLFDNHASH